MSKKNGLFRIKAEFEQIPIMDSKKSIKNEDDFDSMVGDLKLKLFGR